MVYQSPQFLFGMVVILSIILSLFLVRHASGWLRQRRYKRQFVEYIRPSFLSAVTRKEQRPVESDKVGKAILEVMRNQEDRCETRSLERIPSLGEKAPKCCESLGRCLGLLDAYSSCVWECSNGDHKIERLVARATNSARASMRLAQMGFYDEALSLTRSVGEIANLLSLFSIKRETMDHWKRLEDKERRKLYSPVRVRLALKDANTPIYVEDRRYGELSSRAVHVTPDTSPQLYDGSERPKGAGYFQELGILLCLNELALSITFVIFSVSQLSHLDRSINVRLLKAGKELIQNAGAIGIDNLTEIVSRLTKKSQPTEQ